jgi:hypothetical protein
VPDSKPTVVAAPSSFTAPLSVAVVLPAVGVARVMLARYIQR